MPAPHTPPDPPRVTVAQAIVIAVLLVLGFFALENGLSLVFLLLAMGLAAFVLNRLVGLAVWWATRRDQSEKGEP